MDKTHIPEDDGITHINIYSRSNTILGKALSNFDPSPVEHPEHGRFSCVEGYWQWLKTGKMYEEFRTLPGHKAKSLAKGMEVVPDPKFHHHIRLVLLYKALHAPRLLQMLVKSGTLPIVHYYTFGHGKNRVVRVPHGNEWINVFWTKIRDAAQLDIADGCSNYGRVRNLYMKNLDPEG